MKKILASLIAIIMLSLFAFATVTTRAVTSGYFNYEVLKDGTAQITGYTGSESDLLIPESINGYIVSSLARESFRRCNSLVSVTIPNSVTKIDSYAFEQCDKLESVTLPDSIKSIGYGEFFGCKKLNNVIIPEGVKIIDTYAFHGCSGLKSIILPDSVIVIERNAFDNSGLTEITIPKNVVSIGLQAFFACMSLEKVTFSGNIKVIYQSAFYYCDKLKSVHIPASVDYIDETAFGYTVGNDGYPTRSDGFIIYGKAGTEAEAYAANSGIAFEEKPESIESTENITEPTYSEKPTDPPSLPFRTLIIGDTDGDGEVTVVDATFIQRYLAGIETPDFGIGAPIRLS